MQKVIYEMGERNERRMAQTPTQHAGPGTSFSVADELAKLQRLRTDGVLSEDEFRAEKARLLRQG